MKVDGKTVNYRHLKPGKGHNPFATMKFSLDYETGEIDMLFSFCSPLDCFNKAKGRELVDERWEEPFFTPLKSRLLPQESIAMCGLRTLESLVGRSVLPQWLESQKGVFDYAIKEIVKQRHYDSALAQLKAVGRKV